MADGTTTVANPATGKAIAEVPAAGVAETDTAVARALSAFSSWRRVAPADRAQLLRRFAGLVEDHLDELALTETRNVGKPIADSRGEVAMVAEVLHFYAGAIDKHHGTTIPVAGGLDYTVHEPLGVVAAIVPWNFPLAITSWKVAPALACGNTVVVKPAELTPLTALRFAELALAAGLPEGVLQVVTGPGSVVGNRLVDHPDVAKVAFTGSTEVGRQIMSRASGTLKRVTLELGGKSANVVFADADLEKAAAAAPLAVFGNAGQDCCARSRVLVERTAFDRFVDLMAAATDDMVVGDPEDPATVMGPLVSSAQRESVRSFLDATVAAATVASSRPGSPFDRPGWWMAPAIVAPADPTWRVAREEVFGPIACIIPFDDETDAVRIANDTVFGLSGSIWTSSSARAVRMAREVAAGTLSVNSNTSVRVATPFGGVRHSGFGRELGMEALGSYSEVKNVFVSADG